MAASCNAGMYFTPSFEAIQVVPQKKLIQQSAKIGNPTELILDWIPLFIFCINYKLPFMNWYFKTFSNLSDKIVFPTDGFEVAKIGSSNLYSFAFCE
jgi:hypothetical protein